MTINVVNKPFHNNLKKFLNFDIRLGHDWVEIRNYEEQKIVDKEK